jgi:hypothetical protein
MTDTLRVAYNGTTTGRTHLVRSEAPTDATSSDAYSTVYDGRFTALCGLTFDGFVWNARPAHQAVDCKRCLAQQYVTAAEEARATADASGSAFVIALGMLLRDTDVSEDDPRVAELDRLLTQLRADEYEAGRLGSR